VVGVTPLKQLPSKALKIDSDGMTAAYSEGNSLSGNRQDAQAGCYPNGALYVFSVIQFRGQGIPVAKARPLIMSISESLDIDELADLEFANSIAPCVEKLLK
jgi:CMP-N-acetylneuraminic acid synthetase